ncbi:DALR domain-containing protein, partial [Pedobacter sp.]
ASADGDIFIDPVRAKCVNAMNDDFNSPVAIAELFEAARMINTVYDGTAKITAEELEKLKTLINDFVFEIFGLKDEESSNLELNEILEMVIDLRKQAKENKDYATSDSIRLGLQNIGIQLKDSKEGTTWSKV